MNYTDGGNSSELNNDSIVLSYCRFCGVVHPLGNHEDYLMD